MSIDEIYDLFIWDASYSEEEYALRVQQGIAEASRMKNLYPFIQPLIIPPQKTKSVWESCAEVVARRTDEELEPYLNLLFEWLQDMNWPGAVRIYNRLSRIPPRNGCPPCSTANKGQKKSMMNCGYLLWRIFKIASSILVDMSLRSKYERNLFVKVGRNRPEGCQ